MMINLETATLVLKDKLTEESVRHFTQCDYPCWGDAGDQYYNPENIVMTVDSCISPEAISAWGKIELSFFENFINNASDELVTEIYNIVAPRVESLCIKR